MTTSAPPAEDEEAPPEAPVDPKEASAALAVVTTAHQLELSENLPLLARVLIASKFFPNVTLAAQAVVKVLAGKELGFGAIASMRNIDVIQGQVSFRYPLVGAAIKRHPRHDYRIKTLTNDACEIEFFGKRDDAGEWELVGTSTFTKEDAEAAGLSKKPGGTGIPVWRAYTRNMLFARALTNGARWHCPDIFMGGVYVPEELEASSDG